VSAPCAWAARDPGARGDLERDLRNGDEGRDGAIAAERPQHVHVRAAHPRQCDAADQRRHAPQRQAGGTINPTIDGVNNASNGFKSGGTSFFATVAPRLGVIEEVTVETAGLGAGAHVGAEGGVSLKFITRRGSRTNLRQNIELKSGDTVVVP
jgi:hypothetical protein